MKEFRKELRALINKCSMENGSNTPDFILAEMLDEQLKIFDEAICKRRSWYYMENAKTLIRQALARGYTHPQNAGKILDNELIDAMAEELVKQVTDVRR